MRAKGSMAEFEGLADAYAGASQGGAQYRQEIVNLTTAIGKGLGTYLSCPPGIVGYYPVIGKAAELAKPGRAYSILEALEIDEGDSHWHFGLTIRLNSLTTYVLHFAFFKRPTECLIGVLPDGPNLTLAAPARNDSLLPLFDALHKHMIDYLDNGLSGFLECGGQPRRSGSKSEPADRYLRGPSARSGRRRRPERARTLCRILRLQYSYQHPSGRARA